MNETELLDLWQSNEPTLPSAFTVRELAHREPTQRAGAARLPPVSADCATFLASTLEAHRARTLRRLQVWEFFEAGRALDRLQDLMGWSPRASAARPVLALSLALLCLVLGVGLVLRTPPRAPAMATLAPDPTAVIEDLLAECRTYSNAETGKPDWRRAAAACQQVLEKEPIHSEAAAELERIARLELCEQRFDDARRQIAGGRLESALDSLGKIGAGCEIYLLRALPITRETMVEVKQHAAADCKRYAASAHWDLALSRCELYSRLACQRMAPDQLYPPPLMALKLEGPLNPKSQWRPPDPVYLNFLKARARLTPGSPPWVCPQIVAFRSPPAPPDPAALALGELAARSPEPELGRALALYFQGDFAAAPVPLQKISENLEKARFHQEARALLLDLNNAINLYENGTAALLGDHPEKAEAAFRAALSLDERLILGVRASTLAADEKRRELARRESFLRRSIVESMSEQTYEQGKALADRKDFRGACRMWKLGATFSRTHLGLLRALTNVCTHRAMELSARAQTCEQWKAVLDFAVDGDGYQEKARASLTEEGCP